VNVFQNE